jgi:hypothetical protein
VHNLFVFPCQKQSQHKRMKREAMRMWGKAVR